MTILSCKTIFGPSFSAILENLLEPFFRNVPKTSFWPTKAIFGLIWPNLAPKTNFLGKMTFLSNKTILGLLLVQF